MGGLEWLREPAERVAPRLLGMVLATDRGGRTAVRITEVEAYGGADDAASHAHRGRTPRNASMFLDGGHVYVYRIHQVVCLNVVTGPRGGPEAVLVRAGEPIEGVDLMRRRRGRGDHLTDGPGKLCQALGIGLVDDGGRLGGDGISLGPGRPPAGIVALPRVGISRELERPWRFRAVPTG